jgi:hypothetical protein
MRLDGWAPLVGMSQPRLHKPIPPSMGTSRIGRDNDPWSAVNERGCHLHGKAAAANSRLSSQAHGPNSLR